MDTSTVAALVFAGFTIVPVLFQLALAAGAPWGSLSMGGRFPGRFPPAMRVAAIFQGVILAGFASIVLLHAGVLTPDLPHAWHISQTGVWVVVVVLTMSLIMNIATPSKWERIVWAPVVAVMLACAVVVAIQ